MKKKRFNLAAIFFVIVLNGICKVESVFASPINIAGAHIDGIIQTNTKGKYDKILLETKIPVSYKVYPPKRAASLFLSKKFDCILPGNLGYMTQKDLIQTAPFNKAKLYLFMLKSEELKSISDIKNQNIIVVSGIEYPDKLKKYNLKYSYASNEEAGIKMLLQGRENYMLGYFPDLNRYKKEFIEENIQYDAKNPIEIIYDTISCHNTEASQNFIKSFNKKIEQMKSSGKLIEILGDDYID